MSIGKETHKNASIIFYIMQKHENYYLFIGI